MQKGRINKDKNAPSEKSFTPLCLMWVKEFSCLIHLTHNRSCMIRNTLSCQGFLLQRLIAADLILLFFSLWRNLQRNPLDFFSPKDFFFQF